VRRVNKYRSLDDLPLSIRVSDLIEILDISRSMAYELVRSGEIPSFKVGRHIRIPKDAIQEFFQRQRDLK